MEEARNFALFSPLPQQILSLDYGVRQHPVRLALVVHLHVDVPNNETQRPISSFDLERRPNMKSPSMHRNCKNHGLHPESNFDNLYFNVGRIQTPAKGFVRDAQMDMLSLRSL